MKIESALRRLVAPLQRRVMLAIGRAIVRLVDDARSTQEVQLTLLAGEVRDGVERLAEYGFTSVPLDGAQAVALFVGGNRDHGVVIATGDRRHRPTGLEPGESAIHDHQGQIVHVRADGSVLVKATGQVTIDAPLARCTGNLRVEGLAQVVGAVLAGGNVFAFDGLPGTVGLGNVRDAFNVHFHVENDNAPAPTQPPSTQLP